MEEILKMGLPALLFLTIPGWLYTACKRWVMQDDAPEMGVTEFLRVVVRSMFIMAFGTAVLELWGEKAGHAFYDGVNQAVLGNSVNPMFAAPDVAWHAMEFLVLAPIVLGLVAGLLHGLGISADKLRQLIPLPALSAKDQAWDQAFGLVAADKRSMVVEVQTKKQTFYGRYGKSSCVSRSGGYRDIFLNEVWFMDPQGFVAPDPLGSKMLIKGNQIENVRFVPIID